VLPFRYREQSYVNALQWSIGLELFLLVRDPWRVVLTTDHPNGAPFTSYPHLMRLLMDKPFRDAQLARLHPEVAAQSALRQITRELSLYEIADHDARGARAPARAARPRASRRRRGGGRRRVPRTGRRRSDVLRAAWVFKDGEPVVRDGRVVATPVGATHFAEPDVRCGVQRLLDARGDSLLGVHRRHAVIGRDELCACCNGGRLFEWACAARSV
jgi:formylmethanofuran dehydrogenase subunit A